MKELPLVGLVPQALVFVAVLWAAIGTAALAVAGLRLPGLEFRNQRVEAAYRKELVLGEDDAARARPPTLRELFGHVRANYFRLYANFLYLQRGALRLPADQRADPLHRARCAVDRGRRHDAGRHAADHPRLRPGRGSFQYLVQSWTTHHRR